MYTGVSDCLYIYICVSVSVCIYTYVLVCLSVYIHMCWCVYIYRQSDTPQIVCIYIGCRVRDLWVHVHSTDTLTHMYIYRQSDTPVYIQTNSYTCTHESCTRVTARV